MSNVTISEIAGGEDTSPANTAKIEIEVGGVSKFAQLVNILKNAIPIGGTTPAAGAFTTLSATGLITATGGQIAFPATAVPSADANTLDDYEEGTWTPVYSGSAGSKGATSYTTQSGSYTKIGRSVILHMNLVLSNNGDWTNEVGISGVPFMPVTAGIGMLSSSNITYTGDLIAYVLDAGAPYVIIYVVSSGGTRIPLNCSDVPDNGGFRLSIPYEI